MTESEAKFRRLRESGYRGPIDHRGEPVPDLDRWIADHLRPPAPAPDSKKGDR
ncbi:hypothetical protein [Actinokineospora inagensis]|uniref:hypothetical protein n=1 Tax=Actinokineospora inagensis TaxID=103730 RepID=UPI0004108FAF|nr:hypothetical protein [Actinokineospora inagensis]